MARRPEPWYWKARKGWYVQVDNKQVPLGKAEVETKNPPPEVQREWHRLMAVGCRLDADDLRRATVPELIEVFLESKACRRESTVERYTYTLAPVAERFPSLRAGELRPRDVTDFCESRTTWGESGKARCVRVLKQAWEFGRARGYFEVNPLAGLENPYSMQVREHAMTEAEYRLVRGLGKDPGWRFLVDVLWFTGARPAEACKLEARHLDAVEPKATLASAEHKTGGKSGRSRVIFFPDETMAGLRRLAADRPEGPLLRNARGGPWTRNSICARFYRWRQAGKIPAGLVLYAARHGFVTRKINEGHSPSLVAKAVGHANTKVTEGVYYNPAGDALVKVARGDIRQAVEEERDRTGGKIDVDRLVQSIVEGVVARLVVGSPPTADA